MGCACWYAIWPIASVSRGLIGGDGLRSLTGCYRRDWRLVGLGLSRRGQRAFRQGRVGGACLSSNSFAWFARFGTLPIWQGLTLDSFLYMWFNDWVNSCGFMARIGPN